MIRLHFTDGRIEHFEDSDIEKVQTILEDAHWEEHIAGIDHAAGPHAAYNEVTRLFILDRMWYKGALRTPYPVAKIIQRLRSQYKRFSPSAPDFWTSLQNRANDVFADDDLSERRMQHQLAHVAADAECWILRHAA